MTEKSFVGEGLACRWWMRILHLYSALVKGVDCFFCCVPLVLLLEGEDWEQYLLKSLFAGRQCHSCAESSKVLFLCCKWALVALRTCISNLVLNFKNSDFHCMMWNVTSLTNGITTTAVRVSWWGSRWAGGQQCILGRCACALPRKSFCSCGPHLLGKIFYQSRQVSHQIVSFSCTDCCGPFVREAEMWQNSTLCTLLPFSTVMWQLRICFFPWSALSVGWPCPMIRFQAFGKVCSPVCCLVVFANSHLTVVSTRITSD